ncbi:hypothetical protein Ctob_005336 [Chrysochromulina tobinii]|uniref:EF-hand domain-containing protein n=1 Tax=Chrysochromulina tobinii TaxID=1460289 RepID=A0A0M0J7H6_9EUKA|nr:hypothetical protein Ctob_005336 [Chrysochromulina tobinii]|eukprot:KOO22183.1 hypothetical protein Ctob_005336 [Chrysochromulina sp. CCMP291]
MVGSFVSLTSKLGNTLNKYFESGKKEMDIFKEMDKNGDGKISKMEFRQYLRDIGIMGKAFTAAQVDKLFMELDVDLSGELSPSEIVEGVVLFKKNAKEAKEKTQKAEANAAHWRARAACAEKAAEAVRRYEDAKLEIERIKNEPSAESRLAEMFRKKNLKPMDMMQQFDNDKNGAIDLSEFMFNIRKMGLEASDEDLGRIFASFDSDGSGTLDMKELQTNMHKLNDAQSAEAELLKTLQKDLKTLQLAAQAEQELAEEKALFEEKVYERRLQKQNTIAGIKDTMPMPLAKALTKRKSGDEED